MTAENLQSSQLFPEQNSNPFVLLELEQRFSLDDKTIETAWLRLGRKYHPDRFATKGAAEKQQAALYMAAVNNAYSMLRDVLKRAAFLVENIGKAAPVNPSQMFMMEMLEAREMLLEGPIARQRLHEETQHKYQQARQTLAVLIDEKQDWQQASQVLAEMRFLRRLLDESAPTV